MKKQAGLFIVVIGILVLIVGLCFAEMQYNRIMRELAREVDR